LGGGGRNSFFLSRRGGQREETYRSLQKFRPNLKEGSCTKMGVTIKGTRGTRGSKDLLVRREGEDVVLQGKGYNITKKGKERKFSLCVEGGQGPFTFRKERGGKMSPSRKRSKSFRGRGRVLNSQFGGGGKCAIRSKGKSQSPSRMLGKGNVR